MSKDIINDIENLEKFSKSFRCDIANIESFISFLNLSEEDQELCKKGIKRLKKISKRIKHTNIDDMHKIVNLKEVNKIYNKGRRQ